MAGATKNSSHITTLKSHHGHHFLTEFIAGANESSKSYRHIFLIRIKKSLRARSPYAIFNWNVCIIHSRLHWGAGLGRSVVYASMIAIYIGALVLTGWQPMHQSWPFTLGRWSWRVCSLCINHSHLHWGAGLDRLAAYASIMAIYIGALVLTGWQPMHQCSNWLCHCCPAFVHCFFWLSHCFPTSFQCFHWFPQGERIFFQNKRLKHLGVRGTKPCGRAVKINNLMKDLYYLD